MTCTQVYKVRGAPCHWLSFWGVEKRLGIQIYLMMIMACFEHECSSHHELRNSETIFKIKEKSVSKRKKREL